MQRPLDDLVVLDLTRALAGPLAGRLLSDLGARVVKVEPPDGDLTRSIVPHVDGMSAYYVQCNAGKECVSVDLAHPDGRELLLRMVERADIVLENYRPGVMARLGLGYGDLAARNPRVIVASISGWGHGNSRSGNGAFAAAIHAETGITAAVARERGDAGARNDPVGHADVYAGLHALAALLAALHQRHRTGRGQAVEVSMAEAALVANDLAAVELTGLRPDRGFRAGQHRAPIYPLRSGRLVNVLADPTTPGGFAVWVKATGRADLDEDARFATEHDRAANRAALDAELGAWVAGRDDAGDVEAAFAPYGVVVAEVRTVEELAHTPWAAERGAFVAVECGPGRPVVVPQAPWRFSDAGSGVTARAGFQGQHNADVLGALAGAAPAELDRLAGLGVLHSRPLPGPGARRGPVT